MNNQEIEKAIDELDTQTKATSCTISIKSCQLAISALEKQIPKKPDKDDYCTTCSTYLKDDNDVEGDYCPNCGQAVDWSVKE